MRHRNRVMVLRQPSCKLPFVFPWAPAVLMLVLLSAKPANAQSSLHDLLKASPFKIAYESYVDDNSDIFVMNADGSNPVNLTQTPKEHEHYPQISPDSTKMCFAGIRSGAFM